MIYFNQKKQIHAFQKGRFMKKEKNISLIVALATLAQATPSPLSANKMGAMAHEDSSAGPKAVAAAATVSPSKTGASHIAGPAAVASMAANSQNSSSDGSSGSGGSSGSSGSSGSGGSSEGSTPSTSSTTPTTPTTPDQSGQQYNQAPSTGVPTSIPTTSTAEVTANPTSSIQTPATPPATTATPPATTATPTPTHANDVIEITKNNSHDTNDTNETQVIIPDQQEIIAKIKAIDDTDNHAQFILSQASMSLLFNNFVYFKDFLVNNFSKDKMLSLCIEFINQIYPAEHIKVMSIQDTTTKNTPIDTTDEHKNDDNNNSLPNPPQDHDDDHSLPNPPQDHDLNFEEQEHVQDQNQQDALPDSSIDQYAPEQ